MCKKQQNSLRENARQVEPEIEVREGKWYRMQNKRKEL